MTLGYHVRLRLTDDSVIASTPAERRVLARVVLAQGQACSLLGFGLADNHLHLVVACRDRGTAVEAARRIELSLVRRLPVTATFQHAYLKPIEDARHLYNAFAYSLSQDQRHELGSDPTREATNLPDLLGLRVLGAATRIQVRRFLPRVRRADLLRLLGVGEVAPASEPIDQLREATLAAAGLPELGAPTREVTAARRAAVAVAAGRLRVGALQELLATSARTIRRSAHLSADGELVAAIRRQLDLRGRLGARLRAPGSELIEGPVVSGNQLRK